METGSTPVSRGSPATRSRKELQQLKKKEKRKPFHMFHRRGLKKSKQQTVSLSDNFPAMDQSTSLMPDTGNYLSLSNTWNATEWKQGDREDSGMKVGSIYSSNTSLLSAESETRELTDDELVDALVNPQHSIGWPPPPEVGSVASGNYNSSFFSLIKSE